MNLEKCQQQNTPNERIASVVSTVLDLHANPTYTCPHVTQDKSALCRIKYINTHTFKESACKITEFVHMTTKCMQQLRLKVFCVLLFSVLGSGDEYPDVICYAGSYIVYPDCIKCPVGTYSTKVGAQSYVTLTGALQTKINTAWELAANFGISNMPDRDTAVRNEYVEKCKQVVLYDNRFYRAGFYAEVDSIQGRKAGCFRDNGREDAPRFDLGIYQNKHLSRTWWKRKSGEGVCIACESGKFSGIEGATMCQTCPTHTTISIGATVCLCSAGHVYDIDSGQGCRACEVGKFVADGGAVCTDCGAGFSSSSASSTCVMCAAGRYVLNNVCTPCPGNSSAPAASDALADCVCNSGSYGVDGVCTLCAIGKYKHSP